MQFHWDDSPTASCGQPSLCSPLRLLAALLPPQRPAGRPVQRELPVTFRYLHVQAGRCCGPLPFALRAFIRSSMLYNFVTYFMASWLPTYISLLYNRTHSFQCSAVLNFSITRVIVLLNRMGTRCVGCVRKHLPSLRYCDREVVLSCIVCDGIVV